MTLLAVKTLDRSLVRSASSLSVDST